MFSFFTWSIEHPAFESRSSIPPLGIQAAYAPLRSGATAAIASRHVPGARFVVPQSLGRRAGGTAFRLLTRSLVPGVADTQCGFKFFRRDAVKTAIARVRTSGFAFDVELLAQVHRDGGRIVEIPVAWTDGAGSTFRPVRDGVASFRSVLNLRGSVL